MAGTSVVAGEGAGRAGSGDPVAAVAAGVDWGSALPERSAGLRWRVGHAAKRTVDVVGSAVGIVVLSPVLVLIAAAVALDSPGPILYEWRVLGYRGRRFTGFKFRTMVPDAEDRKRDLLHLNEMDGPVFKIRDDPRVTGVGKFLRRYSLDELPQLWSVLIGDMSLVGPRPPSPEEFLAFEPWQRLKLAVTPGITCLWQVSGRSEITSFSEWAELDLEYIRSWNLWLDLVILLRTAFVVVRARGAY